MNIKQADRAKADARRETNEKLFQAARSALAEIRTHTPPTTYEYQAANKAIGIITKALRRLND